MNSRTFVRRAAATSAVFALAASPLLGISSPARADDPAPAATDYPEATKGATVDWFDDKYPALAPGSVFETVTFERFEYLLKKNTGKWAFVVGGPEDSYLQDTIGYIDEVAKAEGIEKIYNFDPNLDGEDLSVFDLTGYAPYSADNAGKDQFLDLGERLVTNYLSKDAETPFTLADDASRPDQRVDEVHPYLFVYDAAGGDNARIVDALVTPPGALGSPAAVTAYKQDVKRVLDSATLDVDTQWDFLSTEHNRRHYERYVKNADPAVETSNRARFGGDIFNAADDLSNGDEDDFRIESVTYPELLNILDSDGDFVILFGGTWCHNTAAIIKQTAEYARRYGIKKVYNFDFSLDSTGNGGSLDKHIRDNAFRTIGGTARQTRPSHLYGKILEKLSNAQTQYRILAEETGIQSVSPVKYYTDGTVPDPANPATGEKLARKIQVGHLLSYNKDHEQGGQDAPVLDQAIRSDWTNPEVGNPAAPQYAGNVEYMTEWWFTLGKDDTFDAGNPDRLRGSVNVSAASGQNSLQNRRFFAKEAIRDIRDVIARVAGGYESEVAATGLPTSVAAGETTDVSVQVDVTSEFDGFYSDRTASAQTSPLTGSTNLGGSVSLYVDDTKIGEADVTSTGTATVTGQVPALSSGAHEIRAAYSGGGGGLVKASEKVQALDVVAEQSATTLGTVPTLTYGAGGQVTATVTSGATGAVSLNGLPGGALTATLSGGSVTFTIPASVPAGTYPLTATYAGDGTYASSSSASSSLVVAKALTISQSTASSVTYGKGGKLTVKVTSPVSPSAPIAGQVTLTGAGAAQTATVQGGTATFTLPKNLAVGKYSAKLAYAGTGNLNASQSQVSYTVTKAAPSKVAFAATKKPTSKKAGTAKVTVTVPSGLAAATGTVKVVLKKGKATKTVTAKVVKGVATVKLPKLAKGTWTVTTTYNGDGTWTAKAAAKAKVKVTK